jgi:hypothetical protein
MDPSVSHSTSPIPRHAALPETRRRGLEFDTLVRVAAPGPILSCHFQKVKEKDVYQALTAGVVIVSPPIDTRNEFL